MCSAHVSSDVTMVDHVFMFKVDREESFFLKVFDDRLRILVVGVFCHVMLFLNFLDRIPFIVI